MSLSGAGLLKSLDSLEKKDPELVNQLRKIYRRIEILKSELDKKLSSQQIINLTLSNRIEKLKKEGK